MLDSRVSLPHNPPQASCGSQWATSAQASPLSCPAHWDVHMFPLFAPQGVLHQVQAENGKWELAIEGKLKRRFKIGQASDRLRTSSQPNFPTLG